MKRIPLTKGKEALVDDEDYDFLMQWKWHVVVGRYAGRKASKSERTSRHVLMHRIVARRAGHKMAKHIDHKDGNGFNNRRANLRPASCQNNMANSGPRQSNTSGYKGVSYDSARSKWRATIHVSGRTMDLGRFDSKREAAKVYNTVAAKHFGEFAYLNPV